MELILAEPFKSLWRGKDAFAEVERLEGQVYRELEGRRTLRTEVDGRGISLVQDSPRYRLGRDRQESAHRQGPGARRRPGMAGDPAPARSRRTDHDRRGLW
ncbi:hypothetical protein SSTU70S_02748 [Stutzerimonas stutzeri]